MARNASTGRLPVLGLDTAVRFRSAADRASFSGELTEMVTRLVAAYHDEDARGGRWQRVTVTVHPVPKGVDREDKT